MHIQDIMKPHVITVSPDATLDIAFSLLVRNDIHHLVVTEGLHVVGILAASDLAGLSRYELNHLTVKERMSSKVVSIHSQGTLKQAAEEMRKHHFESLPVCDEGQLVGIVTVHDLLDIFTRDIERLMAK